MRKLKDLSVGVVFGVLAAVTLAAGAAELASGKVVYTWSTIAGTTAGGLSDPIITDGSGGLRVGNTNVSTKETPASASPISVTGNNTVILNANTSRHGASLQNLGTAPAYCCLHATVCSSTAYDFVIGNAGGASGAAAMSTSYTIGPQPVIWSGGVTCDVNAAYAAGTTYMLQFRNTTDCTVNPVNVTCSIEVSP